MRVSQNVTLPETHHAPAERLKRLALQTIALDISDDLLDPEFPICRAQTCAQRPNAIFQ
jgi:hypothetical protein